MAAATPVRPMTVRAVLVHVGIALAGLAVTVGAAIWSLSADAHCTAPPGPTRTAAVRFAGTADRVAQAKSQCPQTVPAGWTPRWQAAHDAGVLHRAALVIVAGALTLLCGCRLANGIVRRTVTLEVGRRLAFGVLAVAAVNLFEDIVLEAILRDTRSVPGWVIGLVTALAVTRVLALVVIGTYAVAGLAAGVAVLFRSLLGLSLLPQFDRPLRSVTDPVGGMARRLEDLGAEAPLLAPRAERFLAPDGSPWRSTDATDDDDAVGVCFSGGGIRAASYALGALQGFLAAEVLSEVRYLSTVSGGGYTGTAWQIATRAAYDDRQVVRHGVPGPGQRPASVAVNGQADTPPLGVCSPEAKWLQTYARFLWPPVRTAEGHPGGDTCPGGHHHQDGRWASTLAFLAVAWNALRGVVFNASLLVTLLFVVSRPLGWLTRTWAFGGLGPDIGMLRPFYSWQLVALGLQTLAVVVLAFPVLWRWWGKMAASKLRRVIIGAGTTGFAAWSTWTVLLVDHPMRLHPRGSTMAVPIGWCFVIVGTVAFVTWARMDRRSAAPGFGIAVIGLGVAKLWLDGGFHTGPHGQVELDAVSAVLRIWALLGMALLMLAVLRLLVNPGDGGRRQSRFVFIGLLVLGLAMTALTVVLLAPRMGWWSVLVVAGPLAMGGYCANLLTRLPPDGVAFVGGPVNEARTMFALLAALTGTIMLAAAMWAHRWIEVRWAISDFTRWLVLAGAVLVVYAVVDQKWWSPHGFYKRRLSGTFSPVRSAEVDADGQSMVTALPLRIRTTLHTWARRVPGQPELLVCAAAYDTERISPEDNQALPFVFTADYVGSADVGFARSRDFDAVLGRQNEDYGTLRAAATISGAAVSPALGAVRLASLSQIMAFFNLRLGVWLPSPSSVNELRALMEDRLNSDDTLRWVRTRRLGYLLKELIGRYDTEDRFLYVTDGGQFENLGLYELLVRKCRLIYAFDASADKGSVRSVVHSMRMAHDRLGVDFGPVGGGPLSTADPKDLPTEWRLHLLRQLGEKAKGPEDASWPTGRLWAAAAAVFEAWYPPEVAGGERTRATVVYCQARLARDKDGALPDAVVASYAKLDRKFPNNGTGDQFIDDAQFDAYVHLGRWAAADALRRHPVTEERAPAPKPARTSANGDGPALAPPVAARTVPTTTAG